MLGLDGNNNGSNFRSGHGPGICWRRSLLLLLDLGPQVTEGQENQISVAQSVHAQVEAMRCAYSRGRQEGAMAEPITRISGTAGWTGSRMHTASMVTMVDSRQRQAGRKDTVDGKQTENRQTKVTQSAAHNKQPL